jgi:hypothetical protein
MELNLKGTNPTPFGLTFDRAKSEAIVASFLEFFFRQSSSSSTLLSGWYVLLSILTVLPKFAAFIDASDTHMLMSESICRLGVSSICELPRLKDDTEYLRFAVKIGINVTHN